MGPRFARTPEQTTRARRLRAERSAPERILWTRLSRAQMGVSVRRQHPIGPYTLDFYAPAVRLAIEVDGGLHGSDARRAMDKARDAWFEARGIETARVWEHEIIADLDAVAQTIHRRLHERAQMLSLPLQGGGQGGGRAGATSTEHSAFAAAGSSPCPSLCKGGEAGGVAMRVNRERSRKHG